MFFSAIAHFSFNIHQHLDHFFRGGGEGVAYEWKFDLQRRLCYNTFTHSLHRVLVGGGKEVLH